MSNMQGKPVALTSKESQQLALESYKQQLKARDPLRVEAERKKNKYNEKVKASINLDSMKKAGPTTTFVDMTGKQEKRWKKLPKKSREEEEEEAIFLKAIGQPGPGNVQRRVTRFQRKKEDATLARIRALAEELRKEEEAAAAAAGGEGTAGAAAAAAAGPVANAPPASKEGKKKEPGFWTRFFGKGGRKRGRKRITRKKRGGRKRKNKTKTKRKTLRKSHKKRRKMARRKKTKRRR